MEYKDLIINILKDNIDTIPLEMQSQFINYIENKYNKYLKEIINNSENSNKYIKLIQFNANILLERPVDDLKSLINYDKFYQQFLVISNTIFQKALYKKNENNSFCILEQEKNDYINKINQIVPKISQFNQKKVTNMLSDLLVDLEYISGGETISLRVNRN